jgi:glycosyltransferase involved in cell wall biosynthesis
MEERVEQARRDAAVPIIWIPQILPREEIITLYTHASVFVCPSVYEPFGIINLEAMACKTPVVASAVGGIKEVVIPGETGLLVPFEATSCTNFEPRDPARFVHDLAAGVNQLLDDPQRRRKMGLQSRDRVKRHFSWSSIARRTLDFYSDLRPMPAAEPPRGRGKSSSRARASKLPRDEQESAGSVHRSRSRA